MILPFHLPTRSVSIQNLFVMNCLVLYWLNAIVVFITGNGILTKGASNPWHPWSVAAVCFKPRAADWACTEELPTLPEWLGQVRVPGVPAGAQHKTLLQCTHKTHRGNGTNRLHTNRWQSLPKIWIHISPTEVWKLFNRSFIVPCWFVLSWIYEWLWLISLFSGCIVEYCIWHCCKDAAMALCTAVCCVKLWFEGQFCTLLLFPA